MPADLREKIMTQSCDITPLWLCRFQNIALAKFIFRFGLFKKFLVTCNYLYSLSPTQILTFRLGTGNLTNFVKKNILFKEIFNKMDGTSQNKNKFLFLSCLFG